MGAVGREGAKTTVVTGDLTLLSMVGVQLPNAEVISSKGIKAAAK